MAIKSSATIVRALSLSLATLAGCLTSATSPGAQTTETTAKTEPIPASLIAAPPNVTLTWPWSSFWPTTTTILLSNSGSTLLGLQPPTILTFRQGSGADATNSSLEGIALSARSCGSTLSPGTSCALNVNFNKSLMPGTHVLAVGVGGTGGGWSQQSLNISAGLSIGVAFLIAVIGLMVGICVDDWRTRGKPLADSVIRLRIVMDRLATLKLPTTLALAAENLKSEIETAALVDQAQSDAALLRFEKRSLRLAEAARISATLDAADATRVAAFRDQAQELFVQLARPDIADDDAVALAARIAKFDQDWSAWKPLAASPEMAAAATPALPDLSDLRPSYSLSIAKPVEELRKKRQRYQWSVEMAVVTLGAIALVSASKVGPAWGSVTDILQLFMLGVGARVAFGAVRA